MPLASPVVKYSVVGDMANGAQDMSWGFYLAPSGTGDFIPQSTLDTMCAAVGARAETLVNTSSVNEFWTANDGFSRVDCYQYNGTGARAASQSTYPFSTRRVGTGTANHPKQVALVVSTRTPVPGRSGRGRFYLPATGIGMTALGLVSDSSAIDGLGVALGDFFDDIQAAAGDLAVVSFTTFAINGVTSLVIDNKPDTQRRREDKISPTHIKVQTL